MTKSQLYDSLLRVQSDVDSAQISGALSSEDLVTVSPSESFPPPEMSLYDGAFVESADPGPSMFSVYYDNKEGEYRLYVPAGSVWYDGEDISPKGYDGDGGAVPVSLGETLYCYVYMKKKEKSGEEEEDTWEIQKAKVGGESDKPKGSDVRLLAAVPIAKLPSASFDADPESGEDDFRQYHIGALCFTAGGGGGGLCTVDGDSIDRNDDNELELLDFAMNQVIAGNDAVKELKAYDKTVQFVVRTNAGKVDYLKPGSLSIPDIPEDEKPVTIPSDVDPLSGEHTVDVVTNVWYDTNIHPPAIKKSTVGLKFNNGVLVQIGNPATAVVANTVAHTSVACGGD